MKKLIKNYAMLLLAVLIALPAMAQDSKQLPLDPTVRVGKLKNGLTYYIRHNELPEGKANFYIAQKVGSIQEEEHQRGLAHFLEHMCFNGTEHFPGKSLINYLETIGVKFGADLNAYTSIGETVYNIDNVPVARETTIDSCLLILYDWANALTLAPEEIDAERLVIHEEWRQRRNAGQRMLEEALPTLFPGSPYANCMPIGTMEVIDNFPYQALRDYYEKWYRPDLQGIIIVGDIDVDLVEKKIKKLFKGIKLDKKRAEREYIGVADNEETIHAHVTDKEQQDYSFMLMFKHDATPREQRNTEAAIRKSVVNALAMSMLNKRFSEIMTNQNPPYRSAGVGYGGYLLTDTKEMFSVSVTCKTEQITEALPKVLLEVERASRHGFTASELEREIASSRAGNDAWYAERDKRKHGYYINRCVNHFLNMEAMMAPEVEYEVSNRILDGITLEEVNAVLPSLITVRNIAILSMAPERDDIKYPSANDIEMLLTMIAQAPVEPYVEAVTDGELLTKQPTAGKIVSSEEGVWGSTVWTLSNGIKVVVKPTDFKADEISFHATSWGGTNRYPDSDIVNLRMMSGAISSGGYGEYGATQLAKMLAGTTANVSASVSGMYDVVSGATTAKDLEKMFQLLYLTVTSPRKDEAAFEGLCTRTRNALKDRNLNPNTALSDTLSVALYNNHPRTKPFVAEDLDRVDYDRIIEIYNDRFSDMGDFTFVFVGNINLDELRPLVERYLGGLPTAGRKEAMVESPVKPREGVYRNNFKNKMETPAGTELIIYTGDVKYNLKSVLTMSLLSQVLDIVYTEEVREKEGGTYGVMVAGSLERLPEERGQLMIQFSMDPERREALAAVIVRELEKMAKDGPKSEHVEKVRSYMHKSFQTAQKENGNWLNWLSTYYFDGLDSYTDYEKILDSITYDDIRKMLADILKQNNMIEVSMTPEK